MNQKYQRDKHDKRPSNRLNAKEHLFGSCLSVRSMSWSMLYWREKLMMQSHCSFRLRFATLWTLHIREVCLQADLRYIRIGGEQSKQEALREFQINMFLWKRNILRRFIYLNWKYMYLSIKKESIFFFFFLRKTKSNLETFKEVKHLPNLLTSQETPTKFENQWSCCRWRGTNSETT